MLFIASIDLFYLSIQDLRFCDREVAEATHLVQPSQFSPPHLWYNGIGQAVGQMAVVLLLLEDDVLVLVLNYSVGFVSRKLYRGENASANSSIARYREKLTP